MRRLTSLFRLGSLVWLLTLSISISHAAPVSPTTIPAHTIVASQQEFTEFTEHGWLKLLENAPPAPAAYGTFSRFGFAISSIEPFNTPFQTIQISYTVQAPAGSSVRFDLRSSADGLRWTEWEIDLASGSSVTFATPARFAQYRTTLLSNGSDPVVQSVSLVPQHTPMGYTAMSQTQAPLAPTFRVHATRQGMVGGRTANGHRITKRDRFVSLPSWRALSSNGGNEYLVRISYNGRSALAPVYDVGPWNAHDNYWDEQRERYGDLRRGWPEDHAAYFDGYNHGRAEQGKVRFPTAIDIGDGVWWDDLGINGDRTEVEVTFLWLGRDPLEGTASPAAQPEPSVAPDNAIVVDDRAAAFKGHAAIKWYDGPKSCGQDNHALWTYSTTDPAESENGGRWQPALPAEALYDVYVAVPGCARARANTASARYLVQHRDGTQAISIDQAATAGTWVLLGRFPFRGDDSGYVELLDVTGDSMHTIWFDAVKWVPVP